MANNIIVLLATGSTNATSASFEVLGDAPVSLYLVPQAPATDVPSGAWIAIERQTSTGWALALNMRGNSGSNLVLIGQGTFRAHRPAQVNAVGLELVETGA